MSEAKSNKTNTVQVGIAETRRDARLHVVDLLCSVGRRCSGVVMDLSESGVCVSYTGSKRYEKGDSLGMALRRHDVLVLVKATVMWTKGSGIQEQVVGFEFEEVSAEDKKVIRELVSDAQGSATAPTPAAKTA